MLLPPLVRQVPPIPEHREGSTLIRYEGYILAIAFMRIPP